MCKSSVLRKSPDKENVTRAFLEFQYLTRVSPCVKVTKSMMAGGKNKTKHTSSPEVMVEVKMKMQNEKSLENQLLAK